MFPTALPFRKLRYILGLRQAGAIIPSVLLVNMESYYNAHLQIFQLKTELESFVEAKISKLFNQPMSETMMFEL